MLFILLMGIAFIITLQQKNYQKSEFINSANSISGGTFSAVSSIGDYLDLKTINQDLASENAMLRSQLKSSLQVVNGEYVQIDDTLYRQKYVYRVASVISNSINRQNNYLTLNLGKKDGVFEEMGVISPRGVVGVVRAVSDNYCTVLSFLHPMSSISCKILNTGNTGYLEWNNKEINKAELGGIIITTKVNEGDSVVTSGLSSLFPEGIFLGVISKVEKDLANQSQKIDVDLEIDFSVLNKVYIVENLHKEEILELQKNEDQLDEK